MKSKKYPRTAFEWVFRRGYHSTWFSSPEAYCTGLGKRGNAIIKVQSHVLNSERSVGKCTPFDGRGGHGTKDHDEDNENVCD
jgi:hypothetical protein